MIKKIGVFFSVVMVFVISATAQAGIPAPSNPNKSLVAHCGCNIDGSDLTWHFIEVSKKSKGHQQHDAGDMEECYDESEVYVDTYERDYDDCVLAGPLLDGVSSCGMFTPIEGASCSD